MNHPSHMTPEALVDRALERATELMALKMISSGSQEELETFTDTLHTKLEAAIISTLTKMEQKIRINEALKNPKIQA